MVVPVSCPLVVSCCVDRCGSSVELLCSFAPNSQSTLLDRHFGLAECETFTLLHRYSPATSLARRIVSSENSIRLGVRNTLSGAPLKTFLTRRCKKINYPSSSVGFLFLFLQRLHIHRSRRKSSRSSWSVAHGNNYPYHHLCEACRTSFRSPVDRRDTFESVITRCSAPRAEPQHPPSQKQDSTLVCAVSLLAKKQVAINRLHSSVAAVCGNQITLMLYGVRVVEAVDG